MMTDCLDCLSLLLHLLAQRVYMFMTSTLRKIHYSCCLWWFKMVWVDFCITGVLKKKNKPWFFFFSSQLAYLNLEEMTPSQCLLQIKQNNNSAPAISVKLTWLCNLLYLYHNYMITVFPKWGGRNEMFHSNTFEILFIKFPTEIYFGQTFPLIFTSFFISGI